MNNRVFINLTDEGFTFSYQPIRNYVGVAYTVIGFYTCLLNRGGFNGSAFKSLNTHGNLHRVIINHGSLDFEHFHLLVNYLSRHSEKRE